MADTSSCDEDEEGEEKQEMVEGKREQNASVMEESEEELEIHQRGVEKRDQEDSEDSDETEGDDSDESEEEVQGEIVRKKKVLCMYVCV